MNIFNLLNNFFREDAREKVSSSATKLYFFLIYEANKSYWEGPLMLSVRRLSSLLSFSKNTVSKSLSELEDRGLIICYPREGNGLTADKEGSLTANEKGGLTADKGDSISANKEDSLTANREGGFMADEENDLTANKEASLKRSEGGSRKESFRASKEVKGASSSAFWFADLQLRETASRQTRGTASQQMKKEKKEVWDKGESKYAKFF